MSKIFFEFANKLLGDVKNLKKMSKKTIDLYYVVCFFFEISDVQTNFKKIANENVCRMSDNNGV